LWLETNGLRLAEAPRLAGQLKDAGLGGLFLQFDGRNDEAHRLLRGRPLLALKERALAACAAAELPVILTATVAVGINDRALIDLVFYAAEQAPTVRGLRFQPLVHMGRVGLSGHLAPRKGLGLSRVLALLEQQSGGVLRSSELIVVDGPSELVPFCLYLFAESPDELFAGEKPAT
jgi:uncharacterized radical SAM superfamily Fe-S cluster-containing enzyme